MMPSPSRYRYLEEQKIVETVRMLRHRIAERFPGSSLGQLVEELERVAIETLERSKWIQRPNVPLRLASAVLVALIPCVLLLLASTVKNFQVQDITSFIQNLDAGISSIVFIGAAVLFLVTWERRIKRSRALEALHELRAMAHIVDMHQLTKDPESHLLQSHRATASSPKRTMTPFELNRYLDYCSETLAMISKIAALYAQGFQDSAVLDAVDDLEDLVSGLTRNIWQKISILETIAEKEEPGGGPARGSQAEAG